MDNKVEKYDPTKVIEGIKDRIKSSFVGMIPDDMWNNMVEKEVYIFTTGKIVPHHEYKGEENGQSVYNDWEERVPYDDKPVYDNWGKLTKPGEISPLRQMIRDELRKRFETDLQEWLNSEEYKALFNTYGAPEISKAVEEVLVNNADTIFKNFMASIMQQAFDSMRCQVMGMLQNGGRY